jgi:hypothetical protein
MKRITTSALLFVATATVASFVFWQQADWWYYVQDPIRGPWPKFQAPPWEQYAVSTTVGTVTGGLVTGIAALVWGVARQFTSREEVDNRTGASPQTSTAVTDAPHGYRRLR